MKIAMMTNNYKPFVGGVPISIELLAKGLIAAGHEVTVFAPAVRPDSRTENFVPEPEAVQSRRNECDGVPVFRYASLPFCFLGGAAYPNPFDPQIEEEFRRGHYDIIHVHHPMLIGRTAVYLSRRYGVPLVFTYHTRYDQYLLNLRGFRLLNRAAQGRPVSRGRGICASLAGSFLRLTQGRIVPLYLRLFLQNCQQVFAPTAGMQDYLTKVCRFDPGRVFVLPTGIGKSCFHADESAVRKARAWLMLQSPAAPLPTAPGNADPLPPPSDDAFSPPPAPDGKPPIPLFVSVSRLAREKNIPFLLRSAARFKERYQKPFRLALIGDGPDREEYELLCRTLCLEEEVIFTGNISHENIAPFYAAADAFLFASKTETQGIVILEAFAGGAPVIALDASGVRDLVRGGVNGLLCEENEDAFAENLLLFLSNPALQKRMHRQALAAAEDFREEAVVKKAIRFYNKAIAGYPMQESMAHMPARQPTAP